MHLPILLAFAGLSSAALIDNEYMVDTGLDTTAWVNGSLPSITEIWTANDFQLAAKNTLARRNYDYFRTTSLDEITYRKNFEQWSKIQIRSGFFLSNVTNLNLETTILGSKFSRPFFIAPAAQAGLAHPDGEVGLANAAAAKGILYISAIGSSKTTEEIGAAGSPDVTKFRQLYPWSNASRIESDVRRIEAAGFKAIFLTLDNPNQTGIRIRSLRTGGPNSSGTYSTAFGEKEIAALRAMTKLPIIPKGIATWQDVKKCMDLGFKAVYVSNHGGRLVDGQATAAEILLDIRRHVPEAFRRMEIYADGGVRSSTDIIKLLALGARAVGLGRPFMFSNVYGAAGPEKLIDLLTLGINDHLQFMGLTSPGQLRPHHLNTKEIEQFLQ